MMAIERGETYWHADAGVEACRVRLVYVADGAPVMDNGKPFEMECPAEAPDEMMLEAMVTEARRRKLVG